MPRRRAGAMAPATPTWPSPGRSPERSSTGSTWWRSPRPRCGATTPSPARSRRAPATSRPASPPACSVAVRPRAAAPRRPASPLHRRAGSTGPSGSTCSSGAMAHVPGDLPLLIAGTGPEEPRLRALAAGDPRIRFLGFVPDDALVDLYADALAVAFVPDDEDLGLITLEAMGCAHPRRHLPRQRRADGVRRRRRHRPGGRTEPAGPRCRPRTARERSRARRRAGPGRRATGRADHLARRRPDPARPTGAPRVAPLSGRRCDGAGRTAPGGAARPKVVVTDDLPRHPPHGGGQLRCFHLYGALTATRRRGGGRPGRPHLSGGIAPRSCRRLVQTLVPRSPALYDIGEELSGAAAMPVTDIVAGRHIRSAPDYSTRCAGPAPVPTS